MNEIRVANLVALTKKEKTAAAFAKKHGLDATYLSQLMTGHRSFGEKSARNFEEKLALPFGALDIPLEHSTQCLSEEIKGNYTVQSTSLKQDLDHPEPKSKRRFVMYDIEVGAGAGISNDEADAIGALELTDIQANILIGTHNDQATVIIKAKGDSMLPTISSGDCLFVDRRINFLDGEGIYIVIVDGFAMVKRLQIVGGGNLRIISDNKSYEPFTARMDEVHITGRVIRALPFAMKDFT